MFIKQVTLDGFKCYEDKTDIKPLDQTFTAITGMNGAGKSNIIDAILFVLGLEGTKLLRANTTKELINVHKKSCKVTLIFCNKDKAKSPIGYTHFDEVSVSRSIDSEGKSKYCMNNHACTYASISKFCISAGLQKNSFFFVVMQGHITKVLNMKSKDLKSLIEETAGTKAYEVEREKALLMMDKKEVKLREVRDSLQRRIAPLFGRLKEERETFFAMRDLEERKQHSLEVSKKIGNILFVSEMARKLEELKSQIESYVVDFENLAAVEQKLQELQDISSENDFIGIKSSLDAELLKVEEIDGNKLAEKLRSKIEELEKSNSIKLQYNLAELQEHERMLLHELRSYGDEDNTNKFEKLTAYRLRKSKLEYHVSSTDDLLESILQKCNLDIPIDDKHTKNSEAKLLHVLRQQVDDFNNIKVNEEDLHHQKNKLRELKGKINYPFLPGIYGTVEENIQILDSKYQEAVYTILGSRSKHIITSDEKVASNLLKKTDRKISIIPLSKVRTKPISSAVLKNIRKNKGTNMVDLLHFDERLRKAIEHVFGSYFVFEDKNVARKMCFEHKVICVTLDGTVYDFKGTLTGGKMCFKMDVVKRKDIEVLEAEVAELERRKELSSNKAKAIKELQACAMRLETRLESIKELEALDAKILLLTSICDNKIDTNKQLEIVRKNIILATKENKEMIDLKSRRSRLEEEIFNLKTEINALAKVKDESLDKIKLYQQMLAEHELKTSTKRVSERQAEGLEPKMKFLIKSTTKLHSNITKLYRELEGKMDRLQGLGSFADIQLLYSSLLNDESLWVDDNCENVNNVNDASVMKQLSLFNKPKTQDMKEHGALLKENLGIDMEMLELSYPVLSDYQEKNLKSRHQHLKHEIQKLNTTRGIAMDPRNFDLLEKNELIINELKSKIQKLESDKNQISQGIQKFNVLGVKENEKALSHINSKLGNFLRCFIPNSDGHIVARDEYEIKVKIGNWKESLGELSGGQKSLVALCLIFSMLSYKPAPFYIFDEIDAALDLSYTQSIGEIIRKEFRNAQFIVVSLKNGMYDNANSVFKVYTQDNKSKICQIK